MDTKNWIATKCDDIALEKYKVYFYMLDNETQEKIFREAELAYGDYQAMQYDLIDLERVAQL